MLVSYIIYISLLHKLFHIDYNTHNVSASDEQSFIRNEMTNTLAVDLSLDDPILPSSDNKERDLLLSKKLHTLLNFGTTFYVRTIIIIKVFLRDAT